MTAVQPAPPAAATAADRPGPAADQPAGEADR